MNSSKKSGSVTPSRHGRVSDRMVNRLIIVFAALLLIGVPVVAISYYLDRHVDAPPSIAKRAVAAAEDAVRTDPNLLSARLGLASSYAADDRPADAIAQYNIVLESQSGNRSALVGRADAYLATGDLDSAARDYQAFIDLAKDEEMAPVDKQLEAAFYGIGSIQLQQQKPRDAATNLANALVIEKTDADALDLLGQALIQIGDFDNAIGALQDAVALVPTGWCAPYEHLQQAYSAKSDGDGAAYATGMVALCQGKPDDAIAALDPLIGGAYGRDALVGLALIAEQRGENAAAADYYAQVYAINPADFAAITGLARVGGTVPSPEPSPAPSAGVEQ